MERDKLNCKVGKVYKKEYLPQPTEDLYGQDVPVTRIEVDNKLKPTGKVTIYERPKKP